MAVLHSSAMLAIGRCYAGATTPGAPASALDDQREGAVEVVDPNEALHRAGFPPDFLPTRMASAVWRRAVVSDEVLSGSREVPWLHASHIAGPRDEVAQGAGSEGGRVRGAGMWRP